MTLEQIIEANVNDVRARIRRAAEKGGRSADDILLVAVTKTVPVSAIELAIQKKVNQFGENRVQELIEKYDILKERCNWHFIGRLQTNKVKYIVDKVSMVHSVDRLNLAQEIQKERKPSDV